MHLHQGSGVCSEVTANDHHTFACRTQNLITWMPSLSGVSNSLQAQQDLCLPRWFGGRLVMSSYMRASFLPRFASDSNEAWLQLECHLGSFYSSPCQHNNAGNETYNAHYWQACLLPAVPSFDSGNIEAQSYSICANFNATVVVLTLCLVSLIVDNAHYNWARFVNDDNRTQCHQTTENINTALAFFFAACLVDWPKTAPAVCH